MDYKPFADAISAANSAQAPATPYAELANMYRSSFQLPLAGAGAAGIGAAAGFNRQVQDQNDSVARQKKIDDLKEKISGIKDMFDPSKYKQIRREDGGFDYYDPQGKQIQLNQYAQITGKRPYDILKDSENSVDLQYIQDYKSMQELANAFANGDKEYLDKLPDNMKQYLKGKTMNDVMLDFKKQYPQVYIGMGSTPLRSADQQDTGSYPIFNDIAKSGGFEQGQNNFFQNLLNALYNNKGLYNGQLPPQLKQFS